MRLSLACVAGLIGAGALAALAQDPPPAVEYDLIAIGAGAGGLVSAKQSGRRGARSAMISEHMAGGDCLNVGCVPSKALLRCARAIKEVRRAAEFVSR